MNTLELYEKLTPLKTEAYVAQLTVDGLNLNKSDIFSRLIKDAARCNNYSSDVYYDLHTIDEALRNFNPKDGFSPIWIGFRKMGVDGTSFVLSRVNNSDFYGSLYTNYFALYSITVEEDEYDFYKVIFNEYAV